MAEQEEQLKEDKQLGEEICEEQRRLGGLLGFVNLISLFCSSCLVSTWHSFHVVREDSETDGTVYKSFGCGRKGVKLQNLR